MALLGRQSASRAALVAERQSAAERLVDLKVQEANVDAQRVRISAEAGPALYLAKLFGSDNSAVDYGVARPLLDPLAVLQMTKGDYEACMAKLAAK